MYLGNYINEEQVIGPIDQVNAPLLPDKALKLITEIFKVPIKPKLKGSDAGEIIKAVLPKEEEQQGYRADGHKLLLIKRRVWMATKNAVGAGLHESEDIVYKGEHNPGEFLNLIINNYLTKLIFFY